MPRLTAFLRATRVGQERAEAFRGPAADAGTRVSCRQLNLINLSFRIHSNPPIFFRNSRLCPYPYSSLNNSYARRKCGITILPPTTSATFSASCCSSRLDPRR
jgi:hypothetical protein